MPSMMACAPLERTINGMVSNDRFERARHDYQSPTSLRGYTAQNPQSYGYEPIDAARAQFNRTRNLDVFNEYLPYRQALKVRGDQERLARHDAAIHRFVNNPHVEFYFVTNQGQITNLDTSTQYMFAARILDIYHNRPDLIEQVIMQDRPLRIAMFQNLRQTVVFRDKNLGGYFAFGNGDIELNSRDFWWSVRGNDGYDVPVHEYGHAIDSRHVGWLLGWNVADGMLPGLSSRDRRVFMQERARLFELFDQSGRQDGTQERPWLRAYTFEDRWEFLPCMIELFYEKPREMQELTPGIYDIFKRYFRLDPANNYQDLS